jgi:hypothetical protein
VQKAGYLVSVLHRFIPRLEQYAMYLYHVLQTKVWKDKNLKASQMLEEKLKGPERDDRKV